MSLKKNHYVKKFPYGKKITLFHNIQLNISFIFIIIEVSDYV